MKKPIYLSVISALAAAYFVWFLSFPILTGLQGADGEPIFRWQFLTRLLLPELWWGELTGGGQLPLGLLDRVPILVGAAVWLGIAFVLGRPLVRTAFAVLTRVEFVALSMLAGLALLSTLTLIVGLAGGSASRWAVAVPVAGALVVAWFANLRILRTSKKLEFATVSWLPKGVTASGVFGQLAGRLVVVLTIALVIVYALGAMMPPYEFDVVEYHLQSAKEFFQKGSIGFSDHNIYINMPLGLEMHSLAAMSLVGGADGWWLGGLIGKAIIGAHSLIAAALLGGFVARRADSQWIGWCAAGLWLAVPGNAHVAMAGLIDAAMGACIVASVLGLIELARQVRCDSVDPTENNRTDNNRSEFEHRESWLILLIFVFAGASTAAKYTGLLYGVLPCLVATVAIVVHRGRYSDANWLAIVKRWSVPLVCGLTLTCVPWFAKNAVLAGNPVYPLAYQLFGGRGLSDERAAQWAQAHRVPVEAASDSAYSVIALLKSVKQVFVASEFVQPSLMILLVCGFLGAMFVGEKHVDQSLANKKLAAKKSVDGWRLKSDVWAWGAWSLWILVVWWLATHRIDRFWLPAVLLWVPIAGVGLLWLAREISHTLATVLVLAELGFGLLVNSSPVIGDTRFFVSLAALRTDDGNADEAGEASEVQVGRLSRSIAWCNENLDPADSKLLLIGEARAFDFRMPILYSTCFDVSPAETWLRVDAAEERVLERQRENLRDAGVTHVLVNWSELARYRSPGNYGFSDWPTRADMAKLAESGLLRRIAWPVAEENAELFAVVFD